MALKTLVIASHNAGKVKEIAALLAPFPFEVISAAALDIIEPEETGSTFAQNAVLKAEHCRDASGHAALADDSGLEVAALDGAPGIYSARWAGPDHDFAMAMGRIEDELNATANAGMVDRRANFICALALAIPGQETKIFEGRIDGNLVWPPRGTRGFGYDPVFQPLGFEETFGQMDQTQKHAMSHRADAFKRLLAAKPF
ncbi:MAG: RdgB/HAM1 family non-canonical purine NTP pyrophosphatase [Robiginitomaculum sp.]|nr:RdgB/HAM1 family non-canonical purine NTP pyrophosphatase [Robiginitomaculum sp.]MDQ7078800.1 RdgB/HAM1 family non-canonical purine NTP pyrophosphatase [Robiginitomaculum sp.]